MAKSFKIVAATSAVTVEFTIEADSEQELNLQAKRKVQHWLDTIQRSVEDLTRCDLVAVSWSTE